MCKKRRFRKEIQAPIGSIEWRVVSRCKVKKQQHTKGEKIELLLTSMDRVIVTARAITTEIKEEMEAFRRTQYSDSDSSSDMVESWEK